MNITQMIKASRNFVKYSALGLAAAAMLGAGTAQGATTTTVFDLSTYGTTTGSLLYLAQGDLPVGSILRAVSIDAVTATGEPYDGDMCVLFGVNDTPPFALRVGDGYDGGLPEPDASTVVEWGAGGNYGVGNVIQYTKTIADGIPVNFDLNNYAVYLTQGSGYGGSSFTGTITLEYDLPEDPNTTKDILTFSFGALGDATITGTNITKIVPSGTAVTALSPTYTINGASCDPLSPPASPLDFTSPVIYTVTALDSSTKTYAVTVTVLPPFTEPTSPPVTSGMVVWLTADGVNTEDASQIRVSGSDTFVQQWNDWSGNSHNATQGTEGDQPKYIVSGLGGKPVLRFNGGSSEMKLGDLSEHFPTAGSMFAVATINNDGRYNLFENRGNDSRWVADTWTESSPGVFRGGRVGNGEAGAYASWPQTGSHVFSMESSSSAYTFVIDGTQIGTTGGNYHNGNGQNWTIGDRPGNGQELKGDIAELILFDRVLNTTEANLVGGYLAAKYGLTETAYPPIGPPEAPTGLTASPLRHGVRLDWTAAFGATGYTVYRGTETGVYDPTAIATTTAVTYQDKDGALVDGTTYYYVVKGTNTSGEGDTSNEAFAAPSADPVAQTITFGALASKTFGDAPFDLTATASSDLAVSYASSDELVATVSGNTVTILKAGITTITATQAGNDDYTAATPVEQTFEVVKADQAITFTLGLTLVKQVNAAPFADTATGGASGNPVTYTSSDEGVATVDASGLVTIKGLGVTQIRANQLGLDEYYNAAPEVSQSLTIIPPLALPVTEGVVCWYDAGNGVTADGSGNISVWNDLSGLEHHATAQNGSPLLALNEVNSKPAAQLRGNWLNCAGTLFVKEQYVVARSPHTIAWGGYGSFLGRAVGRGSTYVTTPENTTFWNDQPASAVSKNGTPLPWAPNNNYGWEIAPINAYMLLKIIVNDNNPTAAAYQIGRIDGMSCDMDIAEIIGYDRMLSASDEAKLGGFLANKYGLVTDYPDLTPQAQIRSFGFPGAPAATINEAAKTISFIAPSTANVTALAPVFTISADATCDHDSGMPYDFSSPVHYIVHNSTDTIVSDYTVTVNLVAPSGKINLNFDVALRTGLVGPAGGLTEVWNQPRALSGSALLDSAGFVTPVSFANSCDGIDPWSGTLAMLISGARSFGWDTQRSLVLSGLSSAKRYNLYIASFYNNENGSKGVFSTANVTSNGQIQNNDNGGPGGNSSTWVQGVNYVVFKDVKPDAENKITILADGVSGCRAVWSGFQLQELPPTGTVLIIW